MLWQRRVIVRLCFTDLHQSEALINKCVNSGKNGQKNDFFDLLAQIRAITLLFRPCLDFCEKLCVQTLSSNQ